MADRGDEVRQRQHRERAEAVHQRAERERAEDAAELQQRRRDDGEAHGKPGGVARSLSSQLLRR